MAKRSGGTTDQRRWRVLASGAIVCVAAMGLLASACSSDSGSGAGGPSTTASGDPAAGKVEPAGQPGALDPQDAAGVTSQSTPPTGGPNLIQNPSFEADGGYTATPAKWTSPDAKATNGWAGTYGGAHDGSAHLSHWRKTAFEISTSQSVTGLAPGNYVAWIWEKSGGPIEAADLTISGTGSPDQTAVLPISSSWHLVSIPPFAVSTYQAVVTIHTRSAANGWLYADDVHLHVAPA